MPPAQVGATGHRDTSAVLYARLSGALAPPTPKPLRLDPPKWGAPAARVRKRPDSVCQVALETKRATRETPVSLQQLGCALSPWDARRTSRVKELLMKPSGDLNLPTVRRRKALYLLRSHLGGHRNTP